MSHSFIQNCCCVTVHSVKDEQLDTITSLILLTLTLPSICRISSSQCLCWSTGLKLSWPSPKTKLHNVGAGDPSSTILIDHGSHAVLPMTDRLQLGWLTRGRRSWGWRGSDPLKYVGRVRICFDPPRTLHSFIQNCCITATFTSLH